MKMQAWKCISDAVSFAAGNRRTVEELRVKFTNLKSQVKKAYNQRKRLMGGTGGGPPPPTLLPWQELLIDFIGQESLDGIDGGIDTSTGYANETSKACELDPIKQQNALSTLASLATGRKRIPYHPKSMAADMDECASSSTSTSTSTSTTPEKFANKKAVKTPPKPEMKGEAMVEWLQMEKERLHLKRGKVDEQARHNSRMEELAAERLTVEKEKRDMLKFIFTTFANTTNAVQLLPANFICEFSHI